jgi:hypothetical protein
MQICLETTKEHFKSLKEIQRIAHRESTKRLFNLRKKPQRGTNRYFPGE